jgi:hypothetical protein
MTVCCGPLQRGREQNAQKHQSTTSNPSHNQQPTIQHEHSTPDIRLSVPKSHYSTTNRQRPTFKHGHADRCLEGRPCKVSSLTILLTCTDADLCPRYFASEEHSDCTIICSPYHFKVHELAIGIHPEYFGTAMKADVFKVCSTNYTLCCLDLLLMARTGGRDRHRHAQSHRS